MHTTRVGWAGFAAVIGIIVAFGTPPLQGKSKTDVVVMKNGDKFTGEIKKLENGILYFKAEYMVDAVQLDWARVERLDSQDPFNVSLISGKRMIGVIVELQDRTLAVQSADAEIQGQPQEVVSIVPVEDTFWKQLTGSIDYGFSFTGGTNVIQSSLSGMASYLGERWRSQMSGSSSFNYQSGARNSGRDNLYFQYLKLVSDRWFVGTTASLMTSDQQDLTLRTSTGGAVGRDFVNSGTAGMFVLAGVDFSREKYSVGGLPDKNSAEGLLQLQFSKSAFRTLQFTGTLAAYPGLTTLGRLRLSFQSSLQREIVRNLYLKLSIYENYDNRPPSNAPKNDFGTSTSLGWKF
jgi:putative salt-induced outer membrane protein YdiY